MKALYGPNRAGRGARHNYAHRLVPTRYLVDTHWIIDHLNGVATVTARLSDLRATGSAVSIICRS